MARRFRNTSAEYLLTPDITAQSGATRWTVAGWMYHEIQSYTSGGFIYQQASGSTMQFFWDTTGKYYRTRWDTSSGANLVDIGETHLRAQRWHLYTCQYDGAQMRVFLDKTLVGTAAATGGLSNNDGFYFARNTPGSVPFNGSLAHWGMWNRVLSPADIYQLADGRPMLELAPNQLYLPMWGTTPELDLSPNNYSITLGGHPPPFADPPQLSTWRVDEPWMVVIAGAAITINAALGALTLAGQAATVAPSGTAAIAASLGDITIAGLAATVVTSGVATVQAALGALSLSGLAASVGAGTRVDAGLGALTLTGLQATVSTSGTATVQAALGALALSGQGAAVVPSGAASVAAALGTLALGGQAATVAIGGATVVAALGTLTLAPLPASVAVSGAATVQVSVGILILAGLQAAITAAAQATTPADRIYVVAAESRIYTVQAENRIYVVTED